MTTTSKTTRNTKRGNYREAIAWVSNAFASFTTTAQAETLTAPMVLLVSDLFNRPVEKVLGDVASALTR